MNKLLSMELKRAAKSPILWLGVIAVIAMNVYGILLNGYGFKIFTTTFLLENSALICIILAVLIPLYLGSDFENRTINNKISAGYTRKVLRSGNGRWADHEPGSQSVTAVWPGRDQGRTVREHPGCPFQSELCAF